MSKRKWGIAVLALCLFVVSGIFFLMRKQSDLPLDTSKTVQIIVRICPQDSGIYTITDEQRCREIAETVNALNCTKSTIRPDPMSNAFYQFSYGVEDKITVRLDEHTIQVNDELYSADCTALCKLLEQTYYDHASGAID